MRPTVLRTRFVHPETSALANVTRLLTGTRNFDYIPSLESMSDVLILHELRGGESSYDHSNVPGCRTD